MTLSCSLLGLLKPIICLHPSPSPFRFHYIHNSPLCLLPCISNISILLWICVRLHLQNTQHALFLWCPHSCCCPFWSLPKWSSVSCLLFSVSKSCITGLITQERTLAIINIMIKYNCNCDYLFLTKKRETPSAIAIIPHNVKTLVLCVRILARNSSLRDKVWSDKCVMVPSS